MHAAPFLRRLFQGEFAMENVRPVSLSVRTFQDEEPNSKSTPKEKASKSEAQRTNSWVRLWKREPCLAHRRDLPGEL